MSVCSRCGSALKEGSRSCPTCGFNPGQLGPGQGPTGPKPESRVFAIVLLVAVLLGVGFYGLSRVPGWGGRPDTRLTLEARTSELPPGETWDASKERATVSVLKKRLESMNIKTEITSSGRRFIVELPPSGDRARVVRQLTGWGQLEFRYFRDVKSKRHPNAPYTMDVADQADGSETYTFTDKSGKVVPAKTVIAASPVILTGKDLKPNAEAQKSPQSYQIYVAIEFTDAGRKTFATFTRTHISDYLAILLDGRIISSPTIRSPILDGKAIIEGGFKDLEEAEGLAELLKTGALPVPLDVVKVEKL